MNDLRFAFRQKLKNPGFTGAAVLTLALALAAHNTLCLAARAEELTNNRSPRLASLTRELKAGHQQALVGFWKEMEGKAPLVESMGEDQRRRRITFVWRASNETTRVTMMGGLPGANLLKPLARLADTDLWYVTETHSTVARFQYFFHINGPETLPMEMSAIMTELQRNPPQLDLLNTNQYAGRSYVELPDAPPQPWIRKPTDVPPRPRAQEKFQSQILDAAYRLSIYTPPGYKQDKRPCWLLVAFDGGFRSMDATLDNLFAAGKIPPLVVVGVQNINQQTRMRDLNCSDDFATFLAKELVPWARKTYQVYDDPSHTIVGGISLGGKMAAYCGLKHSPIFGKVLSQSGSFLTAARQESPTPLWHGEAQGMLAGEFIRSPRLPLDFYLEVGRYETTLPFSHLLETRRLRDVLEAKGYRVSYSEYVGGHDEVCWRGSFADAIIALTAEGRRSEYRHPDSGIVVDRQSHAAVARLAGGDARDAPAPGTKSFLGVKTGDETTVGGVRLCWCPPGRFQMGSPRREPERRPGEDQVAVTLTKGFWMGKYETTQGQWKRAMGKLPGELTLELPEGDDFPVGNVNFAEAEAFCRKLTDLARQSGELPMDWEFRLPTEAQWEYACRAGTTTATTFGDKLSSKQANFKGKPYNGAEPGPSLGHAAKVGNYPANAWGLHDMHGNIFEWCRDWYHSNLPGGVDPDLYAAQSAATLNRTGDHSRVRRGGAWTDDGWPCRSACRLRFEPQRRYDHIGFRVVIVRP